MVRGEPVVSTLNALGATAEVYAALWLERNGQAREAVAPLRAGLRDICGALRRFCRVFPLGLPQYWLWQGTYLLRLGRSSAARRAFQRCRMEAQRFQMPYEEGRAWLELAHLMPESGGSPRAQALAQAEQLLERIGARG